MESSILMPALSPTMESGTLSKWLVKEGDEVSAGDLIAEIETDKAVMEVEAVEDGKIGRLLVQEGAQEIAVNTPIAVLMTEGEAPPSPDASPPVPAEAAPESQPDAAAPVPAKPEPSRPVSPPEPLPQRSPESEVSSGVATKTITVRQAPE